jgi:uncharacterized iron-regulated protein
MRRFFRQSLIFLGVFSMTWQVWGQANDAAKGRYRVFAADGKQMTLNDIAAQMDGVEVLCLGEKHDDPAAHEVEAELLRLAIERYAKNNKRPVTLSLEMFERDAQTVVDEYLAGLISERHFLAGSRPWNNYATDYKPLIELAKANKLPVLAANAPGRYVNMVSRLGRDSLNQLTPQAKGWLPKLPFPASSKPYSDKFNALMGGGVPTSAMPGAATHGAGGLLDAQTLRDAAMAEAIAAHLKRQPKAFVLQVNGSFHSEEKLGVPEQLQHYRPKTKTLVITVIPDKSFPNFNPALGKFGDFVIISDPTGPRSM